MIDATTGLAFSMFENKGVYALLLEKMARSDVAAASIAAGVANGDPGFLELISRNFSRVMSQRGQ